MSHAHQEAVKNYRKRLGDRGLVRLEVQASRENVPLLRQLAKILRENPAQADNMRTHFHQVLQTVPKPGLKKLLASAPLEGSSQVLIVLMVFIAFQPVPIQSPHQQSCP